MNISAAADDSWKKNVQSAQVAKFRPNSPKVAKDNNFIAKKS